MAEFLTTTGASAEIERVIRKAKEKIIICSPYLKISKLFYERLLEADNNNIDIFILFGKSELSDEENEKLQSLRNVNMFYFHNLHAKCYANEETIIITSMNFYEYSQVNNREMGILINRSEDRKLYDDAFEELTSIYHNSEEYGETDPWDDSEWGDSDKSEKQKYNYTRSDPKYGYCLRCGEKVEYNPNQPYCFSHFSSWSYWQNPLFEEKVCHKCGEEYSSCMNKPLCYKCYTSS